MLDHIFAPYQLVLNGNSYKIPSGFRFFHDANPYICAELISNKIYNVKSKPSEEVFLSFLNYWIKKDVPIFNEHNILQYEELSEEFNIMTDLIETYKRYNSVQKIQMTKLKMKVKETKAIQVIIYYI